MNKYTENWQEFILKDFGELNPKESLKKGITAKKIPMELLMPFCRDITTYEISKYSGGTKFKNDDTIMARITPCLENGKRARVSILDNNEIAFGSTEYIVFRARKGISDANFVYYLVCSDLIRKPAIKSMVGSSGRQRVQTDVIENLEFHVPPLPIQKKIAAVLSALDDKIELNNKVNQNLEQQAQAIFKSWFVDFEPFGGKMPDDWKKGKLKDILRLKKKSIKPKENKLPYLPIDIIPMHNLALKEFKSHSEAKSSLITFDKDDILIGAMRVYFHRVVIAPCKGVTRTTCFILSPFDNNCLIYGLMLCNQNEAIKYAQKTSKGSTMPYAIWDGGLGDLKIIIPSQKILNDFNTSLLPCIKKIQNSYFENLRLAQLRDALLPKLMSGEVDVSKVK